MATGIDVGCFVDFQAWLSKERYEHGLSAGGKDGSRTMYVRGPRVKSAQLWPAFQAEVDYKLYPFVWCFGNILYTKIRL